MSSFVLEVPLRKLRPSVIYSVPCDRIVQRAYLVLFLFSGYLPSFFFCAFMDWDGVEVHKHAKKNKNEANIQPSWPNKLGQSRIILLYGKRTLFSCGKQRVIPGEQESAVFLAHVANHSAGCGSSSPRTELAIYINMSYWPSVRSRWLDIGQVLFLRVYGPRRSRGP